MEQRLPYPYQSVIFAPLYTLCFTVYGQCVKKMKAIQQAALILFMQNSTLIPRDFVQ